MVEGRVELKLNFLTQKTGTASAKVQLNQHGKDNKVTIQPRHIPVSGRIKLTYSHFVTYGPSSALDQCLIKPNTDAVLFKDFSVCK